MLFYLGTHMVCWLGSVEYPLFVSHRRLFKRHSFPRAIGHWALDSGGFSELSMYGRWETTPKQYAAKVAQYAAEIGNLDWASIQDWMCEPFILDKTGLSVVEHQRRTIQNYQQLMDINPDISWTPVIQGFSRDEYIHHLEMYDDAGIDLREFPVVGIGSICRRQHTDEAESIIRELSGLGLSLHGFGFKIMGLQKSYHHLVSADSMAWSFAARYDEPINGHSHKNCSNCQEYALRWRNKVLQSIAEVSL